MKKGFCYSRRETDSGDKVNSVDANWFYNWNTQRTEGVDNKIPFIPMVWGKGSLNFKERIQTLENLPESYEKVLLGFNEPDHKSQSNMSVDKAIELWPRLENFGIKLGSPATAKNPLNKDSWLEQFMTRIQLENLRVDFICIHWYAPPNPDSLLRLVDGVWEKWGKPIWITEFAVADWKTKTMTKYTHEQVQNFMKTVIPELEKRDYVERYTWKTRTNSDIYMSTSTIFNDDGSLTELGKIYKSF